MNLDIIENFLDSDDLRYLSSIDTKSVESDELKTYQNTIYKDHIIQNDCIDEKKLRALNHRYHNTAINLLKKLNPEKAKLYEYSEFSIIETGSNYKFPIHDDTPNKLLSGVVYLRPEKNAGTFFYKNKFGKDKNEIEWKINKAVFFSRSERQTWHSYEGDGNSNRIVLVYNLMTKKIKDVYKIEGKNYFFGQFRYKINYYLYKFLKFTI
jgi:hypothetical protein